jgi:hypothetical protein
MKELLASLKGIDQLVKAPGQFLENHFEIN